MGTIWALPGRACAVDASPGVRSPAWSRALSVERTPAAFVFELGALRRLARGRRCGRLCVGPGLGLLLRLGGRRLLGGRLLARRAFAVRGRRLVAVRFRRGFPVRRSRGRVRRLCVARGRLARRIDQLDDTVPRARGERGAREEERREREARGDPSRGDADLLPPVAGRQHQLPALPSHQGAQERERSREEEHVHEALPGSLCPLWHLPAPFLLSAEGRHIGADLFWLTSAAATESRQLSASGSGATHQKGGSAERIPIARD